MALLQLMVEVAMEEEAVMAVVAMVIHLEVNPPGGKLTSYTDASLYSGQT